MIPGAAHPNPLTALVFAPLPFHIEIVSTLLVHPSYTTQLPDNECAELASRSITFLRGLLATLGPLNGNLNEAFSLTSSAIRGAIQYRHNESEGTSETDDDTAAYINGVVANQGRIRRCAKDFWHIVGWAFNCSVVHHKRWKYWKVWLDYMLDVLDADWNEREDQDIMEEVYQSRLQQHPEAQCKYTKLRKSLVVEYLSDVRGRSSAVKRVVGAAFTDGGADDLRYYPEVFRNETQDVKAKNGQKRKRDNEFEPGFGNFSTGIDEPAFSRLRSESSTPEPSQSSSGREPDTDPWLGGPESIVLRQRVLTLVCSWFYSYCKASILTLIAFTHSSSPSRLFHRFKGAIRNILCQSQDNIFTSVLSFNVTVTFKPFPGCCLCISYSAFTTAPSTKHCSAPLHRIGSHRRRVRSRHPRKVFPSLRCIYFLNRRQCQSVHTRRKYAKGVHEGGSHRLYPHFGSSYRNGDKGSGKKSSRGQTKKRERRIEKG